MGGYDNKIEHSFIDMEQALVAKRLFYDLTAEKIGTSSAANWLMALKISLEELPPTSIVTIFLCAGNRNEWDLCKEKDVKNMKEYFRL